MRIRLLVRGDLINHLVQVTQQLFLLLVRKADLQVALGAGGLGRGGGAGAVDEVGGADAGGFGRGIEVVEKGGKLFDAVAADCLVVFYTQVNCWPTGDCGGVRVFVMSRVVLSPPTEGWAVLSVRSCCQRYAVDFVFSRYDGRGSSRKGVDMVVVVVMLVVAGIRFVLNGVSTRTGANCRRVRGIA